MRWIAKKRTKFIFLSLIVGWRVWGAADLTHTIDFPLPTVALTQDGFSAVTMAGHELDVQSGRPILPVHCVTLAVPVGYTVDEVVLSRAREHEIALGAPVQWGQPAQTPDMPLQEVAPRDPAIYDGEAPYPNALETLWRVDTVNGAGLLSVLLHPVLFDPSGSRLLAATSITLNVKLQEQPPAAKIIKPFGAPLPQRDCAYLIIATSNLIHHTAPWNLQKLCERRVEAGFTTGIVDVAWITANYAGVNVPEKIRAFLQEAHANWGTRYLLIVGTFQQIPTQLLYVKFTDFIYTREAQIPADAIYYGCLDGPFDGNGNGVYGEVNDGVNGGDVDLAAEIMVGRFPVENSTEMERMVRKTLAFESVDAQAFAPNAFLSEKIDMGTTIYATGFLEELRKGSSGQGITTLGFEQSVYADSMDLRKLYDSDEFRWSGTDSLQWLNSDLFTIHHLGHGAATSCFKLNFSNAATKANVEALTNATPYFIYSQACKSGAFDSPNCVAEVMVTVSNGAAAAVMNARDGWEFTSAIGGYSHRYHRCFIDAALRGGIVTLGEINEESRRMNLAQLSPRVANYWRYVYYELNLFGDPATPFAPFVNQTPAVITHEALLNTFETNLPCNVACWLEPIGIYDPENILLLWRNAAVPATVHTQSMARVATNLHSSAIAAHEKNTTIDYAIVAYTHAGVETRWPDAGEEWATFRFTERLALQIFGTPGAIGTVNPVYGTHWYADDYPVEANAPQTVPISEGSRYYCLGYSGNGNIAASGTSNTLAYKSSLETTMLLWNWQRQHSLRVQPFEQLFWSAENSLHPAVSAPAVMVSNGVTLAFAEWQLDGARFPSAPGASPLTLSAITANVPHFLTALYIEHDLDTDDNGIADWYEQRYYGAIGLDPDADDDLDGYTLAEEFADRTDPLNAGSVPAPPVIIHQPLAEVQTNQGPFAITAVITDTHSVTNPVVVWCHAIDPWQITPMNLVSGSLYTANIAMDTAPGDDFEYYITAADPAGHTVGTDTFFFWLIHPEADTSRLHDLSHVVSAPAAPRLDTYMNLRNSGNAPLVWSLDYGLQERFSQTPYTWQYGHEPPTNRDWAISTNRFFSPPNSMYSSNSSAHAAHTPNIATLTTPALKLGSKASLSFAYWIADEVAINTTNYTWDGGIVEISTNNAVSFDQLPGPYTHVMTNWTASPWPADTPCFSGVGTEGWQVVEFNLAAYAGQSVNLRFTHGGDNNTNLEGWYIDDVRIMTGVMPEGFSHDLPHNGPYSTPPGYLQRILWSSIPSLINKREDAATVFLRSNDPAHPLFTFDWRYALRQQAVSLLDFSLVQTNNGSGVVTLTMPYFTPDPEPVVFSLEWAEGDSPVWQPVALAHISDSGIMTNTPYAAQTNVMQVLWPSKLALTATTQLWVKVGADNGFFVTNRIFGTFTVDNQPPIFAPGGVTFDPYGRGECVVALDNTFTIFWPAALDDLSGPVKYICRRRKLNALLPTGDIACSTNLCTFSALATNQLDGTNTFYIVAYDTYGNSNTLSAAVLVLNADTDYDQDGFTSGEEYLRGWDSTRFTCPLQLTRKDNATFELEFPTVAGKLYTLEVAPTLSPACWEPLAGYLEKPGSGTPLTIILPREAPSMFYRVIIQ